jgi:hypothetical protein
MIFSSILIASTFVSAPANGRYEINMGVIKGEIEQPILLYAFLGIICLYYLIWLVIHCRKLAGDQFNTLVSKFMVLLAARHGKELFMTVSESVSTNFQGSPEFKSQGWSAGQWTVKAELSKHALRNHSDLTNALLEHEQLKTHETDKGYSISYTHVETNDDLVFFKIHKDHCWRSRFDQWFVSMLPIIYALLAEFRLVAHILKTMNKS